MATEKKQLTVIDDTGIEVVIPSRFEVCPTCEGNGTLDHPAFCNGITSEEWNSEDWDEDSRAQYLGGAYDVPCHECNGDRVVLMPDYDRLTLGQRALVDGHNEAMREIYECERSERILCGEG